MLSSKGRLRTDAPTPTPTPASKHFFHNIIAIIAIIITIVAIDFAIAIAIRHHKRPYAATDSPEFAALNPPLRSVTPLSANSVLGPLAYN
ncbi:hypothetical protein F4861DRAFT_541299 [Xylaria intraflava]|nr:hypothetical protein F4861DRAFT_541299 [Xylaria intraflava]